jgi:hypothetical protein
MIEYARSQTTSAVITQDEWNEMDLLRREINEHPANVSPGELERFSTLFAESIRGKGDGATSPLLAPGGPS